MINEQQKMILAAALVAIAFMAGSMLGASAVQKTWQLDAATTECAQFNPIYGNFEWVTDGE